MIARSKLCLAALLCVACHVGHWRYGYPSVATTFPAHAVKVLSLPIDLGDDEVLDLDFKHAGIDVSVATDDAPRIRVKVGMRGRDEAEAREHLSGFSLRKKREDGRLRFSVDGAPVRVTAPGRRGGASRTVSLSPTLEVVAIVSGGSALRLRSASGAITVDGPVGACDLETDHGSISLVDAQGNQRAVTRSGSISVEGLRGDEVRLETRHGTIEIDGIRARSLVAETRSGSIRAQAIEAAQIALDTRYGMLTMVGLAGQLRAYTGGGAIDCRDLVGTVSAESRHGSVRLHGVFSSVVASSGSGGVEVDALEGSSAAEDWRLASRHGAIRAALPQGFSAELTAETRHGTIQTDFPIQLGSSKVGTGSRLEGRLGAGGKKIELETSSGSIRIAASGVQRRKA